MWANGTSKNEPPAAAAVVRRHRGAQRNTDGRKDAANAGQKETWMKEFCWLQG